MTATEPRPLPPEGPFCARCETYRVMTPGQECVVCLDERGRP